MQCLLVAAINFTHDCADFIAAASKTVLYTTDKMYGRVGDMHTAACDIDISPGMGDFSFQAQQPVPADTELFFQRQLERCPCLLIATV